ncbi:hypothetical protein B0T14DRAFT_490349 [Immersiella caudata]|uniref:Uncharacterized protein n=1 Tax=Immersiella caudata TaxID=314043 RepID=A0AA39XDE0_9PEZI|nr:hypothetical protein B0T14DRAFT_490349 [Immersiella caudata]
MNVDDIMSDFPHNQSEGIPSGLTAPDTPAKDTHSAAGPSGVANGSGPGSWNTKKFRDEYEFFKARLVDQGFTGAVDHDPLLPRQTGTLQYPVGVTAETEKILKDVIAGIRAGKS